MGTPVVTWLSEYLRGRITHCCLVLTELAVPDQAAYVDLAFKLANDRDYRRKIVSQVVEKAPVLFENPATVRELEGFLMSVLAKA